MVAEDVRVKGETGQNVSEGKTLGARLAVAVLRRARTRQEGEGLFRRMRDSREQKAVLQDLGVAEALTEADIEEARRRCGPSWEKNFSHEVNLVINHVMETCTTMMEADKYFREKQIKVVQDGTRNTEAAVLEEARARCHNFWSKVTPGNVGLIMKNITEKCEKWESADKKFNWLWQKGEWDADGSSVLLSGRTFSREDLEEAERQCRRRFGMSAHTALRGRSPGQIQEHARKDATPQKVASTVANAGEKALPTVKQQDKQGKTNADFLVEHILRKCDGMQAATKFFSWLRAKPGTQAKGRTFSMSDITEAEKKCAEIWKERAGPGAKKKKKKKAKSSSESDSSDDKHASQTTPVPGKALHPVKREIDKARRDKLIGTPSDASVDMIIKWVLRRCDTMNQATKSFEQLIDTDGLTTPLGRKFTKEQIKEAYLRVERGLSNAAVDESSDDDEDSESDASSQQGRVHRTKSGHLKRAASAELGGGLKRQKTRRKGLQRRTTSGLLGDEEYEGALFGSDSEDLSGEEDLDDEDEGDADAPELLSGLGVKDGDDIVGAPDDVYDAAAWEDESPDKLPGFEGFNKRATAVMQKAGIGDLKLEVHFDTQAACPPLQPHQESVGFLVHPKSPVKRLLVDHPTGSGKTREMIKVLDNYFFDSRPKIPIFPKDPVCRNFYAELLRWPSRYRDYFCCARAEDAKRLSGTSRWRERRFHMWDISNFGEEELRRFCYNIREVLEMKGMFYLGRVRTEYRRLFAKKHPGEFMPQAPLRAIGYTSAGGVYSHVGENGKPLSCIMKIGYERGSGNVYSNKIVLMDEAHNLVRTQTQYAEQLQRLRDLLFTARNLVLSGFTGTPILNEPSEGRHLLDIIKGYGAPEGDEGFLSSFPMRPRPLFPMTLPRGLLDRALTLKTRRQLIRKVELHGEALKVYDWKRRGGLPARRLRAYCNVCTFFGSFHDGKNSSKTKVLTFPEDCAPKFFAVAHAVASEPKKAVVMTSRLNGYNVMLELMKTVAAQADPPFGVASLEELAEYNSIANVHGEKYRVLVADAAQCSEGVSFLAVRRSFLCDVPVSPSAFVQQCGRAIRMYGHRGLEDDEQVVETYMYVATLPKWMRTEAVGCWAYRAQKKMVSAKQLEKKAKVLTARLNRAGIRTLHDLRTRIQAHGLQRHALPQVAAQQSSHEGIGLTTEDAITFLEHNGVWEEARLLRQAEKKEQERVLASAETKDAIAQAVKESTGMLRTMTTASLDSLGDVAETGAEAEAEASEGEDDFTKSLEAVLDEAGVVDEPDVLSAREDGQASTEAAALEEVGDANAASETMAEPTGANAAMPEGDIGVAAEEEKASAHQGTTIAPGPRMPLQALDEAITLVSGAMEQEGRRALDAQANIVESEAELLARAQEERKLFNNLLMLADYSPPVVAAMKASGCVDGVSGKDQLNSLQAELMRMQRAAVLTKALQAVTAAKEVIESRSLTAIRGDPLLTASDDVVPIEIDKDDANPVEQQAAGTVAVADAGNATEGDDGAAVVDAPEQAVEAKATAPLDQALPDEAAADSSTAIVAGAVQPENGLDEGEWRQLLIDGGLAEVLHNEALNSVFTSAAPQSMLGPSDIGVQSITAAQVLKLHEELLKEHRREEVSAARPRALVRAMQVLFSSASLEEAQVTLSTETADEEALRQLVERSQEFAPALTAMRMLAVDHEVFAHLADTIPEDEGEVSASESEASDLDKELAGSKDAAVILPDGWKMEWVKRRKREAREFLDPIGRRYYSVKEVRLGIEQWKEAEAAKAARDEAALNPAPPPPKRVRLTKKTPSTDPAWAFEAQAANLEEALEEAFGEAFAAALMDTEEPQAAVAESKLAKLPSTASLAGATTLLAVQAGALVELHSLVARADLNGRMGRLGRFNEESERWECELEDGTSVNVRTSNFEVRGPPLQVARKTTRAATKRQTRKRASATGGNDDEVMESTNAMADEPQAAAVDGPASDSD